MDNIIGIAEDVPYVALPPAGSVDDAPLVVAWHLHDPPRSESAMAAALPLDGLPAWRVFLGLPLSGSRLPEGGLDAFFRLGYEDAVLNVFEPTCREAIAEFPAALTAIRRTLSVDEGRPMGLLGGSVGAMVALGVLAETELPVEAVALVSPAIQLSSVVGANERRFSVRYPWTERSIAVANHFDFLARAAEIAEREAAMLMVVGASDEEGIRAPAVQLWQLLSKQTPERTALTTIPGMAHALAEEPGIDPAPQTPSATLVDAVVSEWFRRHLVGSGSPT